MSRAYEIYSNRPGLEVVFTDGKESVSLFYVIYEWPGAQKFYNLMKQAIGSNQEFISDTSFNVTAQDEATLILRINTLIEAINVEYQLNLEPVTGESDLNYLHQGSVPADGELWRRINDAIHAYEQYKTQTDSEPRMNAYFKYMVSDEISLEPEDFLFFKPDRMFGDLCLNYTYKGKHWLELQSDNDIESITDGQLQPETRIAPDAYLIFRPPSTSPFFRLNKFINWHKENLAGSKITPEMALGYMLVGKLIMPGTWDSYYVEARSQWTRMLANYKTIAEIKFIDNITVDMIPQLMTQSKMDQFGAEIEN